MYEKQYVFCQTAAEADLYPKHCDGVLFFRKSMIINWQYLDVYIIYVCFLPPLLPMCSNFYLTCLLLLVTEVMWQCAVCFWRCRLPPKDDVLVSVEHLSSARKKTETQRHLPPYCWNMNKTDVEYIVQQYILYCVQNHLWSTKNICYVHELIFYINCFVFLLLKKKWYFIACIWFSFII